MVAQNLAAEPSPRNPTDAPLNDRGRQLRAEQPPRVFVPIETPECRPVDLRELPPHWRNRPSRVVEILLGGDCKVRVADPIGLALRLIAAARPRSNGHG